MDEPTLFSSSLEPASPGAGDQLALALADRHAGQAANLAANTTVHRDDRARVERAVALLARSGAAFTADAVNRVVLHDDPTPFDRNLISSVMGTWARDGRIVEDTTLRPVASSQRSRRASRNRFWRGSRPSQNGAAS